MRISSNHDQTIPVLSHPLFVVGKVARGEEPRVELPVDDRDGGGVVLPGAVVLLDERLHRLAQRLRAPLKR